MQSSDSRKPSPSSPEPPLHSGAEKGENRSQSAEQTVPGKGSGAEAEVPEASGISQQETLPLPRDPEGTVSSVGVAVRQPGDSAERGSGARSSSTRPLPAIPGYELLGELGRGGMAIVYKARQTKLDRLVALKVLREGTYASEQELARFRNEALAIARIQHPNVIQVYDIGEHDGLTYLAMEYAGDGTLQRWLAGQRLSVVGAVRLVYTLARAVGAAHQVGITHRDLKPGNILIVNGVPKIADFGLAKQLEHSLQTASGAILGTPQYMAPEQAAGDNRRVGPASDVYALGVILFELLTGRVPLQGDTLLDTLDRVRFMPPPPLRELRGDIPGELESVVQRCLRKSPEERYPNATMLAEELLRIFPVLQSGGATAPRSSSPIPAAFWSILGTVGALILAAILVWQSGLLHWRRPAPTPPTLPAGSSPPSPLPTP
jgi:serine/threonine protein kinase